MLNSNGKYFMYVQYKLLLRHCYTMLHFFKFRWNKSHLLYSFFFYIFYFYICLLIFVLKTLLTSFLSLFLFDCYSSISAPIGHFNRESFLIELRTPRLVLLTFPNKPHVHDFISSIKPFILRIFFVWFPMMCFMLSLKTQIFKFN